MRRYEIINQKYVIFNSQVLNRVGNVGSLVDILVDTSDAYTAD